MTDTNDLAREAYLAEIASRYYVDQFTQEEIARQIGRSVATVSRLLAKAEAAEIVEVRVHYPVPIVPALQAALVKRFGLRTARVARVSSDESRSLMTQISALGARYISTLLTDGTVIAVAWGSTVHGVVYAIPPGQQRDVHVVQGVGSLGSRMPTIDNPLLIQVLAERIDATPHYLPAPMIVESVAVRDALSRDPHFKATLDLGGRADIALVGIGPADAQQSGLVRAGYLAPWEMERVQAGGGVGDMMIEFYDLSGRIVETDFRQRVMGMREAQLRSARTVVAVAGGPAKVPAILGALRTGLIHTLVTDNVTARLVLELDEVQPRQEVHQSATSITTAPEPGTEAEHSMRETPNLADAAIPGDLTMVNSSNRAQPDLASALRALLIDMVHRESLNEQTSDADEHTRSVAERWQLEDLLHQRWRQSLIDAVTGDQERGEMAPGLIPSVMADMLLGAIAYRLRTDTLSLSPEYLRDLLAVFARRHS
jgi:DNA-binding transcriptional regulator LsrR (DeoR family)